MFKDQLASRIRLSKHRLEALADGVFAIAVTLIVLEIKVPELTRGASLAEVGHALRPMVPSLFAFFVTFLICGTFWFLHQMSLHWIAHVDRALIFINIGFLMFVSLMPFSTSMFARFMGHSTGLMFYFGNAAALGLFLNLHWWHAQRVGLLNSEHENGIERRLYSQRIMTVFWAFVFAFVLAPFSPQACGFVAMIFIFAQKVREKRILKAAAANA
jgi:TMEM175 potassium channel family protein